MILFTKSDHNNLEIKLLVRLFQNDIWIIPMKSSLYKGSWKARQNSILTSKSLLACHFNHVQLFAISWAVACHAPLTMGFSRQEYWSGLSNPLSYIYFCYFIASRFVLVVQVLSHVWSLTLWAMLYHTRLLCSSLSSGECSMYVHWVGDAI